jgi:hypothetical protein
MRYASYTLTTFGIAALSYFQLAGTEQLHTSPDAEALPMLFAGASITMGLLMMTLSKGPSIHSAA